jgi:transcription initiation factor TFIIF subunit alpha
LSAAITPLCSDSPQMAKIQKNKDPERWLLHRRKGQGASAATAETFKAEAENRVVSSSSSLVYSSGQSRAVGGRTLRTTNRGPGGGGDDDDEGAPKRKKEENDMEGDLDEQLFDDEFADDEEAGPADMDEEEAKELEVWPLSVVFFIIRLTCVK